MSFDVPFDGTNTPLAARFTSSGSHHEVARSTLDAIKNQLEILQDGQIYAKTSIDDFLSRSNPHERSNDDLREMLDVIEGHLHRLTDEEPPQYRDTGDSRDANAQGDEPFREDQSRSNDDAPHPPARSRSVASASTSNDIRIRRPSHLPNARNHADGPSPMDDSALGTGHSTRLALVQQMRDILSQPDPPAPPPTLEHPPPLIPLVYRPAPTPRSASPISTHDLVQRPAMLPPLSTPTRLHRHRPPRRPSRTLRELEPDTRRQAINGRSVTSRDDTEFEHGLQQIRTERLLAIDQAFVPNPQELGASSRQVSQGQGSRGGLLTNKGKSSKSRVHPSDPPRDDGQGRRTTITTPGTDPAEPTLRQAPHPRAAQAEEHGIRHAEPLQTGRRSPSWYHSSSRRQHEPQPTVMQISPEVLNPAVELMQEIRSGQRAVVEQQREVTRYMRDLNGWLERAVQDRRVALGEMDTRLGWLQDDIHRVSEPMR